VSSLTRVIGTHYINTLVDKTSWHSVKAFFFLEGFDVKLGIRDTLDQMKYMNEDGYQLTIDGHCTTSDNKGCVERTADPSRGTED
jgi:hypothetical protein